jgi:hypothetical protein
MIYRAMSATQAACNPQSGVARPREVELWALSLAVAAAAAAAGTQVTYWMMSVTSWQAQ